MKQTKDYAHRISEVMLELARPPHDPYEGFMLNTNTRTCVCTHVCLSEHLCLYLRSVYPPTPKLLLSASNCVVLNKTNISSVFLDMFAYCIFISGTFQGQIDYLCEALLLITKSCVMPSVVFRGIRLRLMHSPAPIFDKSKQLCGIFHKFHSLFYSFQKQFRQSSKV